jgi:hypothetical protein
MTQQKKLTEAQARQEITRVTGDLTSVMSREWKAGTCTGLLLLATIDALEQLVFNCISSEERHGGEPPATLRALESAIPMMREELWAPGCCVEIEEKPEISRRKTRALKASRRLRKGPSEIVTIQ